MDMIVKNNIKILSFAAMLLFSVPLSAQTVNEDYDDGEEEEEVEKY